MPILNFIRLLPITSQSGESISSDLMIIAKKVINDIWNSMYEYFNLDDFELWRVVICIVGLLITSLIARFVTWFIEEKLDRILRKTSTEIDNLILDSIAKPLGLLIYSIGIYLSAVPMFIFFNSHLIMYFGRICLAGGATAFAWSIYRGVSIIEYLLLQFSKRTNNSLDDMIVGIIRRTLRIIVFIISVLFIGQNILQLNITALLAGAGVAGLAIAFAAQDTIANFFGSVMIMLDRPFKIGEIILVGSTRGKVENIGFRSTKIRTLDGHLLSIPNKKLADIEIENISRRPSIRQVTNLTVTYDTTPEKMQKALDILHEIFDNHECSNPEFPPRIYFNAFNEWSLNIIIITWYHSTDWWAFQQWNHKNNMEILKRFNAEGIDFAFPTHTTYIAGDKKRQIELFLSRK